MKNFTIRDHPNFKAAMEGVSVPQTAIAKLQGRMHLGQGMGVGGKEAAERLPIISFTAEICGGASSWVQGKNFLTRARNSSGRKDLFKKSSAPARIDSKPSCSRR